MKILGILSFALVIASAGLLAADETVKLNVGDKVPSFTAKDADGNTWSSQDVMGKQSLVVYFYPAAFTGGCTKQACSYRDRLTEFKGMDAEIVAVSGDEPETLKMFRQEHGLNFTLLSDPDGSVAQKFGVTVKAGGSIKQTVGGQEMTLNRGVTTSRWTFVIDKEGKIAYVNSQVDAAKDSEAVLATLQGLKK